MPAKSRRFPWILTSAVASAVLVCVISLLEVPVPPEGNGQRAALPSLELRLADAGAAGRLLAEQLAAYDPSPLFVPSPMTSSAVESSVNGREGAQGPFADLPPAMTKNGPTQIPASVPIPKGPVAALKLTERLESPLVIARDGLAQKELPDRRASVEVASAGEGRVVLTLIVPKDESLPEGDWQPFELQGAVNRSGLVGDLIATSGSGVNEIDDFFRSHLRKNVHIGGRLPAGFYVFRIGP